MGFRQSWNVNDICQQISRLGREIRSPYNDGFNAWGCKQDLYQIQQLVNQCLNDCPKFGELEQQYLKNLEQSKIWQILKKDDI